MALNKKRIAKEIIYLFSAFILIALIWGGIEIRDSYINNKLSELDRKYHELVFKIDSIEQTYPKEVKTFMELIGVPIDENNIPTWDETSPIDDLFTDPYSTVVVNDWDNNSVDFSSTNIYHLHHYLTKNNFDFSIPGGITYPKGAMPIFDSFEKEVIEATLTSKEQEELDSLNGKRNSTKSDKIGIYKNAYLIKIYSFLKTKNEKFLADTISFAMFLQGLPEPPSHETFELAEGLKKQTRELKDEAFNLQNKNLYSNQKKAIMLNISLVVFSLLYPVRFILLLLMWAIKTVRS